MALTFGKVANNAEAGIRNYAPALEMGIQSAPSALIIKFLTDMYTKPLEAAIRETTSNGFDASIRNNKPISSVKANIVSFNGTMYFCVQDFGAGMDEKTVTEVYTQYGVSDKRDDADATGAFGLGAKSPLAFTKEFHVLTRTKKEGTIFITAYRTDDGAFLTDVPMKMTSEKMTVEHHRSENGYILAPVLDENGNVVQPKGVRKSTLEVVDPFKKNETGTLVFFPLANEFDVADTKYILRSINDLLYKTSGDVITDGYDTSKKEPYYKAGSFDVADNHGDTVTATIYITDHRGADHSAREVLDYCYSADDPLPQHKVAFKIGDWLYPADGEAWGLDRPIKRAPISTYGREYAGMLSMTPGREVIIDVPSRALPFIPSRDTIRNDSDNDNSKELVEQASEYLRKYVEDKDNLSSLVNWVCETSAMTPAECLSQLFNKFNGRYYQNCFEVDAASFKSDTVKIDADGRYIPTHWSGKRYSRTFTVNPEKMMGCDGFSVAELSKTSPVVFGRLEFSASGTKNRGTYIVSDTPMAKMLGKVSDGIVQAGYGIAKSKTISDSLYAIGYTSKVSPEYAHKQNRDAASGNSAVSQTICFPAVDWL